MTSLKFLKTKCSDLAELKNQYLELSKIHHPDKGGANQDFIELKQEYDQLIALFHQDLLEFKLAFLHRGYKVVDGVKYNIAYLDGVIGQGTLKDPFIGNVQSKNYGQWIIYFKK